MEREAFPMRDPWGAGKFNASGEANSYLIHESTLIRKPTTNLAAGFAVERRFKQELAANDPENARTEIKGTKRAACKQRLSSVILRVLCGWFS